MAFLFRASMVRLLALLLALGCLVSLFSGAEAEMSGKKLRTYLQKKMYKDGVAAPVAKLTASDALDIIQDTQRKFDTLIFLHGTSEMRLPPETAGFRGEFHFFASQVVKNLEENDKEQLDQLIFAEMTYTNKTQAIIIGFGVQSLPSAYFLKRDIRLDSEKGTLTPMRAQDRFEVPFSFDAEDYAKVLKMQHDIDVGDIVKPTFFDNWYAFPLILVVGVAGVTIGWRVYNSEFIKSPLLWASASFSVFAIASSGFFFTLIKKTSWAVHGASIAATKTMQTKYESVIVPFLYLFITMSVLVCVGVVPRIRSPLWRHAACYVVIAVAFLAGSHYVNLLKMKGAFTVPRLVIKNSK